MKVALVGPYPEPGQPITGGVERVIDTLLPELSKHVDMTLVVPSATRDLETRNHGCRTIYLRRGLGPGVLRYWNVDARRVQRAVTAIGVDLVHLHGLAGLGRKISTPRVLTVHGIAELDLVASGNRDIWNIIARRALAGLVRHIEASSRRSIENVIIVNQYVEEALADVSLLNRIAIPNPVDPSFCLSARHPAGGQSRRIVTVGRVGRLKNTLGALRIAAKVIETDPSVTISICGNYIDKFYYEECLDFVRYRGVGGNVEFLGALATQDLIQVLDTASILLVTSLQENSPMAIAEAHGRGVPVLAPQAFGMAHMISSGVDGLFLSHDLSTNADLVRSALEHHWDRGAIAAAARERYGVRRIVQQTLDFYHNVLAAHA